MLVKAYFMAGIHPAREAKTLTQTDCQRLCECIHTVLQAALKQGGTTLRDYYHSDGKPGYFSQKFASI